MLRSLLLLVILSVVRECLSEPVISLDGTWDFLMDPMDEGVSGGWIDPSSPAWSAAGPIVTPGTWQAQGYGNETLAFRHQYIGQTWFRRSQALPPDWASAISNGAAIVFKVDRAHRIFTLCAGGKVIANNTGYLYHYEFDMTQYYDSNTHSIELLFGIDSRWNPATDGLIGEMDMDTDSVNLHGWGGVGHMKLLLRRKYHVEDVHAQYVDQNARAVIFDPSVQVTLNITLGVQPGVLQTASVSVSVVRFNNQSVFSHEVNVSPAEAQQPVTMKFLLTKNATDLWEPSLPKPPLYTCQVTISVDGVDVDTYSTRFGVRFVSSDGYKFILNGRRLFLHGYGDDSNYPATLSPPRNEQPYISKLTLAKSLGFNFVRHHSHVLPEVYFDMADEIGMFISPELPCAYGFLFDKANKTGRALLTNTWKFYVKLLRNHPSIFDWAMCNEISNPPIPMAPELYNYAKSVDPSRFVIDSDGLYNWSPNASVFLRPTLDFHSVQFQVMVTPLTTKKYDFSMVPTRPVISHETGNFATFPRLEHTMSAFKDNVKPYWLSPAYDILQKQGLLDQNEQWANISEKVFLECWKSNAEALRKNPLMSGFEWWLLQDFWTGSNGLVDTYFQPKSIANVASIGAFQAPVVLLQSGLNWTYVGQDILNTTIQLSNFAVGSLYDVKVSTDVIVGGNVVCSHVATLEDPVAIGVVVSVHNISCTLPNIGTYSAKDQPQSISVQSKFSAELKMPDHIVRHYEEMNLPYTTLVSNSNSWTARVFPENDSPKAPFNVYSKVPKACPFSNCQEFSPGSEVPRESVVITDAVDDDVYLALANGTVVVLLSQGVFFPAEKTAWKTGWWLDGNNLGSVVYDNAAPVVNGLTPESYFDKNSHRIADQAYAFLLDEFPQHLDVEVYIRAIDVYTKMRRKAFLISTTIAKGPLIATGLNLAPAEHPEQQYLLFNLVNFASSKMAKH